MSTSAPAITQPNRGLKTVYVLFAGAVVLLAVAAGAKFCLERGLTWTCPSILIFGLPCPGCGGTRALAALANFDFVQAIRFNPLIMLSIMFLIFVPFGKLRWESRGRAAWTVAGALFLLNWIYLLLFLPR